MSKAIDVWKNMKTAGSLAWMEISGEKGQCQVGSAEPGGVEYVQPWKSSMAFTFQVLGAAAAF